MPGGKDEDVKGLREEIEGLKRQLRGLSEQLQGQTEQGTKENRRADRGYALRVDIGDRISDYVHSMIESVMDGIAGELDRSIFAGRHGIVVGRHRPKEPVKVDPKRAADVMSALGNENRVRVLEELSSGGLYSSELQERLSEISASTLSSHLDVLEKSGLVVQEKARGRYLITIPGRLAYRMANEIAKQVEGNFL